MIYITCNKCNIEKSISEFYLRSDKTPFKTCKSCKIAYQKNYYQENVEDIEIYRKLYYEENRDELISKQKIRSTNRVEKISEYQKEYRSLNKDKFKGYRKKRRKKLSFRLRNLVSNAIYQALKINQSSKNNLSFLNYVNYSIDELKIHLDNQFESWMGWDNWGVYNSKTWDDNDSSTWTWQIDHIIPQSDLPYTSMEDENFKKCWDLSNLRPYSAKQNILDGSYKIRNKK